MAVVQNIVTESGDVLYIKTDYAVVGVLALLSFVDSTTGETVDAFFFREFSYSFDNLIWSDYQQLTQSNIINVAVNPTKPFYIKYRYTRQGGDNSQPLSWLSTDILGNYNKASAGTYFTMSSFPCFFTEADPDVLGWYLNVTEKLYRSNLIPKYITRYLSGTFADKDYVDFWLSVTKFFAYYVILAREISQISENNGKCDNLLQRYLEEWGLFLAGSETNEQLNELRANLYAEFSIRGTWPVMQEKNAFDNNDGELLRLISYKTEIDEYLFNLYREQDAGWNIDNASPLYKSLFTQINLNKAYEKTQFIDSTKYPLISSSGVSIVNNELQLIIAHGANNGLRNGLIKIDPYLSYEFSFVVRNTSANVKFDFGLDVYDSTKTAVILNDANNLTQQQYSLIQTKLDSSGLNVLYTCFVYGFNHSDVNEIESSLGNRNFRLQANVKYISPIIIFYNNEVSAAVTIIVNQLKIIPAFTQYERCFLGVKNFASLFVRNNSANTEDTINDDIKRYLLPYNITQQITFLDDLQINDSGEIQPTPVLIHFGLKLNFDWSQIISGADFQIAFTIFKDGVQQPVQTFSLANSGLFNYDIIQSSTYIINCIQNYGGSLEYSFDNVSWTELKQNISITLETFICTANQTIFFRKKVTFNSRLSISNVTGIAGSIEQFILTRTGDLNSTQSVDYTTQDNTAIAGTNYTSQSGTISFGVNETQKIINITTIDDHIPGEADKIYNLNLSNPIGGLVLNQSVATGTIKAASLGFNLRIIKDQYVGFAEAKIVQITNPATSFDVKNQNNSASTVQGDIGNVQYSLQAFVDFTDPANIDVDVIEVQCGNEKQYITQANGNISFLNSVTPDPITKNIDVTFRKCEFIGDEFTATCECDNGCVIGFFTLKTIGTSNLSYDVEITNATTGATIQSYTGTGNSNPPAVQIGTQLVNINVSATASGKTIRSSFYASATFNERYVPNVLSAAYVGPTNIYIEIEEMN